MLKRSDGEVFVNWIWEGELGRGRVVVLLVDNYPTVYNSIFRVTISDLAEPLVAAAKEVEVKLSSSSNSLLCLPTKHDVG